MDYAQNFRQSVAPITKVIVSSVLEEFRSLYRWGKINDNEDRRALDIGFGDGLVTTEILKPFLPASTRLDGADNSEEMIQFARHCFKDKGSKLLHWNIEEEIPDKSIIKSYDHVFSFFCLQYIAKQRQALRNIYTILKPKGNFTFIIVPNLPFYKAIKTLAFEPKWSLYMEDFETMCPRPFVKEKSPCKIITELLSECGFKNVNTRVDVKHVLVDSWDKLEGLARYVDPFRERMPLELQEEYFQAYFEAVKRIEGFWTEKYNENGEFVGIIESLEVLIGYVEKDSQ